VRLTQQHEICKRGLTLWRLSCIKRDCLGLILSLGQSFLPKLLLPLKTYVLGVVANCLCDYFQMSFQFASNVHKEFDEVMITI
jgi:hypothetical protein